MGKTKNKKKTLRVEIIPPKLFYGQPGLINFKVHVPPPHITASMMSKELRKRKYFASRKSFTERAGSRTLKDGFSIPGMMGRMLAERKGGRRKSKG